MTESMAVTSDLPSATCPPGVGLTWSSLAGDRLTCRDRPNRTVTSPPNHMVVCLCHFTPFSGQTTPECHMSLPVKHTVTPRHVRPLLIPCFLDCLHAVVSEILGRLDLLWARAPVSWCYCSTLAPAPAPLSLLARHLLLWSTLRASFQGGPRSHTLPFNHLQ